MTTDGIHEYVSIDELEEFMLGDVSENKIRKLTEKANAKGSEDDKTIIVIDKIWKYETNAEKNKKGFWCK